MFQIEQFTRQALQEALRQINSTTDLDPQGAILAVITGGTTGIQEGLMGLRIARQKGYRVTLVASASAQQIFGRDYLMSQSEATKGVWENRAGLVEELINNHSRVIIPVLTSNSAAKIASARWDNLPTYLVYQALMGGLEIVAARDAALPKVPESKSVATQGNPVIAKMLENNLQLLAEMGIKITDVDTLTDHLPELATNLPVKGLVTQSNKTRDAVHIDQKVLSQRDLESLDKSVQRVSLKAGTVITPLARDYANSKGISLVFVE